MLALSYRALAPMLERIEAIARENGQLRERVATMERERDQALARIAELEAGQDHRTASPVAPGREEAPVMTSGTPHEPSVVAAWVRRLVGRS